MLGKFYAVNIGVISLTQSQKSKSLELEKTFSFAFTRFNYPQFSNNHMKSPFS